MITNKEIQGNKKSGSELSRCCNYPPPSQGTACGSVTSSVTVESSKCKKPRKSNIELVRIVAMLMILVLHTRSSSTLTLYDRAVDVNVITQFIFQALSIIGVNLFILISGYFGIRLSKTGVGKFVYQLYFFAVLSLTVLILANGTIEVGSRYYIKALFPVSNTVWFVPCYLLLMLSSPILNAYIEQATSKQLIVSLGLIYLFTYYSGIVWNEFHGCSGYAAGWFVILYLTGATLRKTKHVHGKIGRYKWLLGYVLMTFLIVSVALLQYSIPYGRSMLWSYECPLVYFSSVCFFLFFVHWDLQFCRLVNRLAASSFAVLLFHIQPFSHYGEVCQYINQHTIGFLTVCALIPCVLGCYLLATVLDQVRIWTFTILVKDATSYN